ncbi:MAG: hypothetical protein QGH94_04940 [Phycisphaerae bacterium]|jgi:hypothetical protein|nr:hypothetical protein [Phycisphaerae bacterium]MDP7287321.1 hypothetical protein [Phycisphaerae bacterium]
MANNPDSKTHSPGGAPRRGSRSDKFAMLIIFIYAVLAGGLCWGGSLGYVLYAGLLSAGFLAAYVAGPAAAVLWAVFMMIRFGARKNRSSIVRSGLKSAVIIFGTIALALWTVAATSPNTRTVSAGFWVHAKLRIDVDEIRTWAARRTPSSDRFEPIDRDQWPESLRGVSLGGGTVTCDPETQTVIFHEGGQYFRWGLTVAPPSTDSPDDRWEIKLADGAWVWSE